MSAITFLRVKKGKVSWLHSLYTYLHLFCSCTWAGTQTTQNQIFKTQKKKGKKKMGNDSLEVQEVTVAVDGFYGGGIGEAGGAGGGGGGGEEEEVLMLEDGSGSSDQVRKKATDRVKGPWSPEEDAILSRLVSNFGARNWSLIARGIPGRSGKSCRLRWCNQLDPAVKRKPFTGNFRKPSVRPFGEKGFYGNLVSICDLILH